MITTTEQVITNTTQQFASSSLVTPDLNYRDQLISEIKGKVFCQYEELPVEAFADKFTAEFPLSSASDPLNADSNFWNGTLYKELMGRILRHIGAENDDEFFMTYGSKEVAPISMKNVENLVKHFNFSSLDELVYKIVEVAQLPGFIGFKEPLKESNIGISHGEYLTRFSDNSPEITVDYFPKNSSSVMHRRISPVEAGFQVKVGKVEKVYSTILEAIEGLKQEAGLTKSIEAKFKTSFRFLNVLKESNK